MSKHIVRKILLALTLLIVVFTASCMQSGEKTHCLTVSQAVKRAKRLNNQLACIHGYGALLYEQTLLLCTPENPCCNRTKGMLQLFEKEPGPVFDRDYYSLDHINVTGLDCSGNTCSVTCQPFNPQPERWFELVGRLRIDNITSDPPRLVLEDLDLAASRQLVNAEWIPIETGSFTLEQNRSEGE